jgi:hypothetical protein
MDPEWSVALLRSGHRYREGGHLLNRFEEACMRGRFWPILDV